MKKIIELVKKYNVYILASLLVVFFFRSCSKSVKVGRLEKEVVKYQDSLDVVKKHSFNEGLVIGADKEKELILDFMDDELRSPQNLKVRTKFEELHNNIDNNKHRDVK
jgi:hypothetical protein